MRGLSLNVEQNAPLRVLCLGAHGDDIEIGCGGTILKLIDSFPNLSFHWIVFGSGEERAKEAVASAHAFLESVSQKEILVHDFKDGFFPYIGGEIKEYFELLKHQVSPDIIFTHYRDDLHQDHRVISELTWNTFRDHLILEYEIPKYDGDWGTPNMFVPLDRSICARKIRFLLDYFQTQRNKHWFTEETFMSSLRLRGVESRAPDNYAEGFYCRKIVIN